MNSVAFVLLCSSELTNSSDEKFSLPRYRVVACLPQAQAAHVLASSQERRRAPSWQRKALGVILAYLVGGNFHCQATGLSPRCSKLSSLCLGLEPLMETNAVSGVRVRFKTYQD